MTSAVTGRIPPTAQTRSRIHRQGNLMGSASQDEENDPVAGHMRCDLIFRGIWEG
jgi:hypothetical protein